MDNKTEKECVSIVLNDNSTVSFDSDKENNKDYASEYSILEGNRFIVDLIKFLKAV